MRYALPRPEILAYPLSTNVIDSVVLNSGGVAPDASGPYMLRRYLVAGTPLSKRTDNTYEQYTGATDVAAGSVWTLTMVGPPTGGTFAVSVHTTTGGQQTTPQQPFNVSAATLQAAIIALSNVGAAGVTVTLSGNVYTLTFASTVAEVDNITVDASQLTGPGNQDVVPKETTQEQTAGAQNVAGILFDTVEFADGSELSDEPVAMLRRNVSFQAAKIVGFVANQSAITTALSTCEFV
jgi:hypothetical protein